MAVVAISPNDPTAVRLDELGYTDLGDSFEDMKIRARDHKYPYPYLYDGETQATAKAYGVLATPHVFIFDAGRKLRYVGRIDDAEVKEVKSHDARNAVDALLAGKPVPVEKTRVFGCSTKWAEKQADARKSLEKWNAEPVSLEVIDDAGVAALVKNESKKLTVINVWATWCGPCVAELPEFVTMNRMYRRRPFRLVTISLDDPEKQEEALRILKRPACGGHQLHPQDEESGRLRRGARQGMAWTASLHPDRRARSGRSSIARSEPIEPLEVKRAIVGLLGRTY